MDRATRLIVLLSTAAALWMQAWLARRAWPAIFPLTFLGFIAGVAAARVTEAAIAPVLAVTYLIPLTVRLSLGRWNYSYWTPWLAVVLGIIAARGVFKPWAVPPRWRSALTFWALSLALSWPIVVLRELDFSPDLISQSHLASSRTGTSPALAILWIASVASIALTGLLFFDRLIEHREDFGLRRFERLIVGPLFAGGALTSIVAAYQSVRDVTFMNPTLFGGLGRASGTMLDGNAYGMIAALWLPFALASSMESSAGRVRRIVILVVAGTIAIGVWGSGSRTALLAAAIGVVLLGVATWRRLAGSAWSLLVAAFAIVVVFGLILQRPVRVIGPIERIQQMVPERSMTAARRVLQELWNRNGYGTAAVHMIEEHPFVGVGIGSYSLMVADVSYRDGRGLPPDNAQNWYRHELAELGVIGSLGWIACVAMFVWGLVRARGRDAIDARVAAARGAIVGFGVASLLGMPGQDAAAALTLVVLVAFVVRATGDPPLATRSNVDWRRLQWLAVASLVVVFLTGTAYTAWTELRPPYRALRAGWSYQHGFYGLEGPTEEQFRWTGRRAVDVFPVEGRWLKLEIVGGVPPDAASNPLDVKVWRDHALILRIRRRDGSTVTRYVAAPAGAARLMVEIEVSRTWQPVHGDSAGHDARDLGVAVRPWTFVDVPPPDAVIVQ